MANRSEKIRRHQKRTGLLFRRASLRWCQRCSQLRNENGSAPVCCGCGFANNTGGCRGAEFIKCRRTDARRRVFIFGRTCRAAGRPYSIDAANTCRRDHRHAKPREDRRTHGAHVVGPSSGPWSVAVVCPGRPIDARESANRSSVSMERFAANVARSRSQAAVLIFSINSIKGCEGKNTTRATRCPARTPSRDSSRSTTNESIRLVLPRSAMASSRSGSSTFGCKMIEPSSPKRSASVFKQSIRKPAETRRAGVVRSCRSLSVSAGNSLEKTLSLISRHLRTRVARLRIEMRRQACQLGMPHFLDPPLGELR
jgi:hypothetical protein